MKYYGTKDNLNYGFYQENFDGAIPISENEWLSLINDQCIGKRIVSDNISVFTTDVPDKYYIDENGLWQIRNDEELRILNEEKEKEQKINELKKELSDLDSKRIRAICEPSIKNEETGESWLDYYNSKIISLRNELSELTGVTDDFE